MPDSHAIDAKKRLMFVKGEDFYFLTYNIVILLNALGCTSDARSFKDHRKLAFLVDFVANPKLIDILRGSKETKKELNPRDRHELVRAYSDGSARAHLIARLLYALEVRDLIEISRDPDGVAADVFLRPDKLPQQFVANELYDQERLNAAALLTLIPRLRTLILATTLKSLFEESGVHTWHA